MRIAEAVNASPLSRELRFVGACCRQGGALPSSACDELPLDWSRVAAIAARHRVESLVIAGITRSGHCPDPGAAGKLEQASRHYRVMAVRIAAEAVRLGRHFGAADIDWLVVKGPPLAVLAYGNPSLKMSRDLDLLVGAADVAAACAILVRAGYRRLVPGAQVSDAQLPIWMCHSKDITWQHKETGVLVELHARLFANPTLLPGVGLGSARQEVEVSPGIALPTLGREPLLLYLAAHGAVSGWARLKWLADYAALVSDPERAFRAAEAAGIGRCAAQGLLLAHELLGQRLAPLLAAELRADSGVRRLVTVGRRLLTGRFETEEIDWSSREPLALEFSQFLLRPSVSFKVAELRHKIANPSDRVREALPRPVAFLYPILGGARWIRRKLGLLRR